MIITVFPDHNWLIWKFNIVPNGHYKKRKSKDYLIWLGKKLGYTTGKIWYKV